MKIASTFMLIFGIIIFARVIEYGFNILWGFPILITGIILLVLGSVENKK